jgi:hypothetical protein
MAQGIHLVNIGMSLKDAASMVNLPFDELQRANERERTRARFSKLGLNQSGTLSDATTRRLAAIHNDVVLRAATKLSIEARLKSDDISALVTAVNKQFTEADQLMVVDQLREQHRATISATAGGRVPVPTGLLRLTRAIAYSERLDRDEVATIVASLPKEEQRSLSVRIAAAIVTLMQAKHVIDEKYTRDG